jgi:sugar lactone lactonase YvrE
LGFVSVVAVLVVADSSDGQPSISGIPAQGPTELFVPVDPPIPTPLRSDAAIVRSRPVRIVREALAKPERLVGRALVLELFDDTVVSLGVERLRRRSPQAYTLTGRIAGADQGFFALVVEEHVVLANIRVSGKGYYQLQYLGQGVHAIQEVDESLQKPCGVENEADPLSALYPVVGTQNLQTLVDDGSELDVVVVYTPSALATAGGIAAVHAAIELGVAEANLSFENSEVSTRIRVVHKEEIDYQESGSMPTDLSRLRDGTHGLDVAHTLRDEYCADVISLMLDPLDPDWAGYAYVMSASRLPPYDFAPRAVHVVTYYAFRGLTFAHELGHNLGARHNRGSSCGTGDCTDLCCAGDPTKEQLVGSYDYSYGHIVPDQWRTVMAYWFECSYCPRMPFYSNPTLAFGGLPTGVPGGHPSGADNASTFDLNKEIAANWRASCTAPDPPELGLAPPVQPGDILSANTATRELFRVDSSGDRGVLSSEGVGSGPSLRQPFDVTLEADGQILMTDRRNRALVRVDPQTGDRMIFSGCTTLDCSAPIGLGPDFSDLTLLTLESSGDALITAIQRSVFRVEAASGDRTILSGCSDTACSSVIGGGPEFISPTGIAVESSGDILVIDWTLGSVLRIDPTSGDRTVVSGCIDEPCSSKVGSGVAFESPYGVVVEADGGILVTEAGSFNGTEFRALFRVNPDNGVRTIVSGCKQPGCLSVVGAGPDFSIPTGLALNASGEIFVTDYGLGAVFRVNPISGDRMVFSGCVDPSCSSDNGSGPPFAGLIGITVVPEPKQPLLLVAGMGLLGAFSRKRARATRHH